MSAGCEGVDWGPGGIAPSTSLSLWNKVSQSCDITTQVCSPWKVHSHDIITMHTTKSHTCICTHIHVYARTCISELYE